jgi:hypothetical protein
MFLQTSIIITLFQQIFLILIAIHVVFYIKTIEYKRKINTIAIIWVVIFVLTIISQYLVIQLISGKMDILSYIQYIQLVSIVSFILVVMELIIAFLIPNSEDTYQFRMGVILKNIGGIGFVFLSLFIFSNLYNPDMTIIELTNLNKQINSILLIFNFMLYGFIIAGILKITRTSHINLSERYPVDNI